MSFVLRLKPTRQPGSTELIHTHLWSIGTTGISELPSGEILAGFETEEQALSAAESLETESLETESLETESLVGGSFRDGWSASVELVDLTAWEPFEKVTTITVASSAGPFDVKIEADQVFGHGKHPTTQLLLNLLERTVKPATRVLDVGTGSGVLGIAAAKLGADVTAIDIDKRAVAAAAANARQNDVEIDVSTTALSEIVADSANSFDVVAINVLLPVHTLLHRDVQRAVKPGGRLLTSGFLDTQVESIQELYQPFNKIEEKRILDWVGFALSRT